jgi:RNA polymerase sigma-70 factor, ECF subfamily
MINSREATDEKLVALALEDVDWFGLLVERYEEKLKRYIMRISSFCPETVEEILQDVFLKTWKNLNGFSGNVKFSSWIYRIAHNETISAFRKAKSRGYDQQVELDENLFLPDKTDFVKEFDRELTARKIQKILGQLPEKYREVLILKFLEDQSYEEIADILHCPMGTVATLMSRAKKQFRAQSEKQDIQF